VYIIPAHEDLHAHEAGPGRHADPFRDFPLQGVLQRVVLGFTAEVHFVADAEHEFERPESRRVLFGLEPPLIPENSENLSWRCSLRRPE